MLYVTAGGLKACAWAAMCFVLCALVMTLLTMLKPLAKPVEFRTTTSMSLQSSRPAAVGGVIVILITLVFYALFSPLFLAK